MEMLKLLEPVIYIGGGLFFYFANKEMPQELILIGIGSILAEFKKRGRRE